MKVAFTYNLRRTDSEEEAEFDTVETVEAIADAIESAGHEVDKIEVSGPAAHLLERIEASDPDIIFNTAEGRGGRMREAFYPALFEEIGVPYTGSDAYAMAVTLDKWLTKLVLLRHGIDTPRGRLINADNLATIAEQGPGLAFPIIVKPNYEGSSKGIAADSVANDFRELMTLLKAAVRAYPDGVLMEEYIAGVDIAVGYVHGVGLDDGLLAPVEFLLEPSGLHGFTVYDYFKKNIEPSAVRMRCPASVPRDVAARLRAISNDAIRGLGLKDIARLDFRVADDGRIYLLEANALPALGRSSSIFVATAQLGLSYDDTIAAILNAAALRGNVATAHELGLRHRRRGRHRPIRVGFTYNVKRTHDGDEQAEFDPPETIIAISNALARQGFIVVHLEATPDLPRVLAEADVDLIFNIAEGVEGRNREAQVPALCELLGIPYTGSDSATLAIALDKALCKKVLSQHGVPTPKFQVMETGRERLDQELKFPLIVKPNAEGSSKGIGTASVVDSEEELRLKVASIIDRYRQPALVEEYVHGREFTIGLLGNKRRLRVLPPMEIRFKDATLPRPVYDYVVKQEWEKHVEYECPARLTEAETRAIERVARATFSSLECRDFARVDLRMAADGKIYVFEVNPLPGMTPGYSDLVLISKGAGMDYDQLMAEIMVGGLRRLREKRRREEREEEEAGAQALAHAQALAAQPSASGNGSGAAQPNGNGHGNGQGTETASKMELAAEKAERAAERAERAAKRMAKLARKRALRRGTRRPANGNGAAGAAGGAQSEIPPTTH
jgi:D-alanine-D-alanine ligase